MPPEMPIIKHQSHFQFSDILLFLEKEAKSVVPLRGIFGNPNLGEADPGGLGECPQKCP
jgi:hypothetical protein